MDTETLKILVNAAVVLVTNVAGYVALRREIRGKFDEHDKRLKVLEAAHGGVLR